MVQRVFFWGGVRNVSLVGGICDKTFGSEVVSEGVFQEAGTEYRFRNWHVNA